MTKRCEIRFLDPSHVRYTRTSNDKQQVSEDYALPHAHLLLLTLRWLAHILVASADDAQQQAFLRVIGLNLFELVFPDGEPLASSARKDFVLLAAEGDAAVDIAFDDEAQDLAGLPWEFMYVPGHPGFFLVDPAKRIALCRRRGDRGLPRSGSPLKVLVLVSDPEGPRLSVPRRNLEEFLEQLSVECEHKVLAKFLPAATDLEALHQEITNWRPEIFHFRGHGERGGLWLSEAEDEVRATREQVVEAQERGVFSPEIFDSGELVQTSGVARLFDRHKPSLVILEACESAAIGGDLLENAFLPRLAADLLSDVPAVIAMQYRIAVRSAGTFVNTLYRGIIEGIPVDEAVRKARSQLTGGRNGNGAEFASRAFGAPVYLGSQGQLCDRLLTNIMRRCWRCGEDYKDANEQRYPNFCVNCGIQMHIRCGACKTIHAIPAGAAPPRACRACHQPFPDVRVPGLPAVPGATAFQQQSDSPLPAPRTGGGAR